MFGNGRAKSGIIVLPCGAGKTLVGITAACTIKKGVIVLCTSSMSVVQWRNEFLKWSNIGEENIAIFTAESKNKFSGNTGIIVTTYTDGYQHPRALARLQEDDGLLLRGREWGLMLLDEVHVIPADVFRRVISSIKSHSKLGLTATLLREDDKISHLNFLIGPKLVRGQLDGALPTGPHREGAVRRGLVPHADRVLRRVPSRQLPAEAHSVRHESAQVPGVASTLSTTTRLAGDKIIVFSDELYSLKQYALKLNKVFIYGGTGQPERMQILQNFQFNPRGQHAVPVQDRRHVARPARGDGASSRSRRTLARAARRHSGWAASCGPSAGTTRASTPSSTRSCPRTPRRCITPSKRQAFLVDQGYAFKVITQLANIENTPDLAFATAQERRELLQKTSWTTRRAGSRTSRTTTCFRGEGRLAAPRKGCTPDGRHARRTQRRPGHGVHRAEQGC